MRRLPIITLMLIAYMIAGLIFIYPSMADTVAIDTEYLKQNGNQVSITMPCNWTKDMGSVTVFGYYGDERFQDIMVPSDMLSYGNNILLTVPDSLLIHANGMALKHFEIDYQTTNKRCADGWQGSFLKGKR